MEPLDREKLIAGEVEKAPLLYRKAIKRAFQGESSPRSAIRAYCLTCTNYDRSEIADCRVRTCPLWLYRPYQPKP